MIFNSTLHSIPECFNSKPPTFITPEAPSTTSLHQVQCRLHGIKGSFDVSCIKKVDIFTTTFAPQQGLQSQIQNSSRIPCTVVLVSYVNNRESSEVLVLFFRYFLSLTETELKSKMCRSHVTTIVVSSFQCLTNDNSRASPAWPLLDLFFPRVFLFLGTTSNCQKGAKWRHLQKPYGLIRGVSTGHEKSSPMWFKVACVCPSFKSLSHWRLT